MLQRVVSWMYTFLASPPNQMIHREVLFFARLARLRPIGEEIPRLLALADSATAAADSQWNRLVWSLRSPFDLLSILEHSSLRNKMIGPAGLKGRLARWNPIARALPRPQLCNQKGPLSYRWKGRGRTCNPSSTSLTHTRNSPYNSVFRQHPGSVAHNNAGLTSFRPFKAAMFRMSSLVRFHRCPAAISGPRDRMPSGMI